MKIERFHKANHQPAVKMADDVVIPALWHHSGLAAAFRSVGDLILAQNLVCDDLVLKPSKAHETPVLATLESRASLWALVFKNGWDTYCPITHPRATRARRGIKSMTQVGTWRVNLPAPVTPSKRRRSGRPVVNQRREAGAPAFVKPNLNRDDFGILFSVYDKNSSCANAKYVA
ncbi:hypothetical protein B0T25DRAFT_598460 [Lasiosphaeria hispida]|uniref:Uncharacterized protein n=1 Tax=Lasiosphaeria hispida TaxID=260671 RepID=A0AAJ0ML12_9PEZI|nr:hypothetical protein B0T25DRAFT_598460 [Lasiosphaeria hispida]